MIHINGILIEFLVGLYLVSTAVVDPIQRPGFQAVRFIIGLVLVIFAIVGFDLLVLA